MLKLRWSCDRLIFNMGIPILGKDGLYIETGPRYQDNCTSMTRHTCFEPWACGTNVDRGMLMLHICEKNIMHVLLSLLHMLLITLGQHDNMTSVFPRNSPCCTVSFTILGTCWKIIIFFHTYCATCSFAKHTICQMEIKCIKLNMQKYLYFS